MSYDEEILEAFKKAALNGKKQLTSGSISLLTKVPERRIFEHLKRLEKHGLIKSRKPKRIPLYWEFMEEDE